MFETIIRGGTVVDGSGGAPVVADVGIRGATIEVVGDLRDASGEVEIDASGLTVTPGFIDVHTHGDLACFLPEEEEAVRLAAVRQGVTTEVVGNCGWTAFPTVPERREQIREHVASVFGSAARAFSSLAEYRAEMQGQRLATNLAPLVGHGTLRAAVLGFDGVTADAAAVGAMCRSLEQALDDGAFGLSTGLVYPPGVYSDSAELIALGRVLYRRGRIYTTHMRNEMERVIEATEEGLDVARRAGARVQLSHLKVAGRERWGTGDRILECLTRAVEEGHDVAGDVYPYTAGSTLLRAVLPPWVNAGGLSAMLERLGDAEIRRKVAEQYETGLPGWQNFVGAAGWDGIVVASAPGRPDVEGRSIAELASEVGLDAPDVVADLIRDLRGEVVVVLHMMSEDDVRTFVRQEDVLIGSDTIPLPGNPHPRTAGTFARVLGRYIRDERLDTLPSLIRRLTARPAERFQLGRRGQVRPSYTADLVVFDAEEIGDRATYTDPLVPAVGVEHVFVDGIGVVRDGEVLSARPGRVLEPVA